MPSHSDIHSPFEVEIIDVAFGGYGVARHHGKVVFIPDTMTGDTVRAEIVQNKKRCAFGRLLEIITPALERVTSACPYTGTCGGCQYRHIEYTAQCKIKKQQIVSTLERVGKIKSPPVADIVPSPITARYRSRIDLHPDENGTYGFRKRGIPNEVVPIHDCLLFSIEKNMSLFPLYQDSHRLVVRTHDGEPYCYFKDDKGSFTSASYNLHSYERRATDDAFFTVDNITFAVHFAAFFQINMSILPLLLQHLRDETAESGGTLLDLYCGAGLFALTLAPGFSKVIGVERFEPAIKYARKNANAMGFSNTHFISGLAENYILSSSADTTRIDTCIVDPSRIGVDTRAIKGIIKANPRTLIYVSCNPATFARDAAHFIHAGWTLEKVHPFDMFPHTAHCELVATLKRK
jgi:tRNA/tmRNA/rRNA uracil-C5-methylase (TrmA/RlmC/RlmD family)